MRRYVVCTEVHSCTGRFHMKPEYRYFRWRWMAWLYIQTLGTKWTPFVSWRSHIVGRVTVRTDLA